MKPVTPFDNFPSFGNAGARQAPGDAKYAQGFLAADTLPAEWANYFFHGSTKGISDLNTAVRSIWLELSTILTAYNITADASETNQLYTAIEKRISSLYPVGTIYQNADSNKNPGDSDMLGFGTWTPITDKFLAARGTTNIGASGGAWGTVLTEANIPQHNHGGSTGGATANISNNATDGAQAIITSATHAHRHGATTVAYYPSGAGSSYIGLSLSGGQSKDGSTNLVEVNIQGPVNDQGVYDPNVAITQNDHSHVIVQTDHTHTIANYGQASPTAISITPTYVGVYTWKRTA